jgi:hypothetical protein
MVGMDLPSVRSSTTSEKDRFENIKMMIDENISIRDDEDEPTLNFIGQNELANSIVEATGKEIKHLYKKADREVKFNLRMTDTEDARYSEVDDPNEQKRATVITPRTQFHMYDPSLNKGS